MKALIFAALTVLSLPGCTTAEQVTGGPLKGTHLILCSYALPISQCQARAAQECPQGYKAAAYGGSINGKKMWARCTRDGVFDNDETQ
jgi:hypothetical protein